MTTLVQYEIFVAVVEAGSIVQAAQRLHYSPPAVSKQLAHLEQQLKVQLFHRSHKKLELSEAGRQFYPRCKTILADIAEAEDSLLAEKDAVNGRLAITLPKALACPALFKVFANFSNQYPDIHFDLRFGDNLEDLHNEHLDFAFRLGKLPDSSQLVALPLFDTQLTACASPDYLKQHGPPSKLGDPKNGKLILMSPLHGSEALRQFFRRENIRPDNLAAHACNDIEGIRQAVCAGMGIGLLLDFQVAEDIAAGRLTAVLPELDLPRKRLYLLYKRSQWQSQKQLAFKKHVKSLWDCPSQTRTESA